MRLRLTSAQLRLAAAVALTVLVTVLGAVDVVRKVDSFRTVGFRADAAEGIWRVATVADAGTGLLPGDGILLVGGAGATTGMELRQRLLTADSARVTVLRAGELLEVSYQRPRPQVDLPYLVLALSGVLYLILGLYALFHGRRAPSGLFFLWCLASAAVYLCTRVPGTPVDGLVQASYAVEELGRLLLPPLTLHLFLVFPAPLLGARSRRLVPFLYLPATALVALQADLLLTDGRLFFGGVTTASLRAFDRLEVALLAGFALAALAALARQLSVRREWAERRQLQWIAVGVFAGYLPFVVLYAVPWVLRAELPPWTAVVGTLPLALVPLTFAWAVLRFRLWDLEVILRSAASYAVTLLLGVTAFSLLHLAISWGLPTQLSLARSALSFASGLAIAAVLLPAERRVRSGLERLQYRGGFAKRRALRELGRELLEERDLARLCRRLQERLSDALGLDTVALYLAEDQSLVCATDHDVDSEGAPLVPRGLPLGALDRHVWEQPSVSLQPPAFPGQTTDGAEQLHELGFRYAFPLAIRHRPVALLLTGGRSDGEPLNSEDLDLLRSVLDQTALAIENARLVEELRDQLAQVTRLKQHSEQILESSPAGIVVLDGAERVVSANGVFALLAGTTRETLMGRRLGDVLPLHPLPRPGEGLREVSYCDAHGQERHLQMSLAACGRSEDDLQVVVVHDVSERVQMENTLKEKERLAALGMLAAGVAHEVNTPITGISSYAQMLLAETDSADPRYELLKKVEKQTFRAANIVNNLLEFARDRSNEHRTLSLATVMSAALESLDDRLRHTAAEVVWEPPASPPLVTGGEQELQQVFVNLIGNALDALGHDGGRLELAVACNGDRVVATVSDDGPGIARAEQERIFRPFYSTKLAAGGTGLGLSISYQIVRRHGGDLRVQSEAGEGSRFIVELPRAAEAKPA
jgi:two-component system NtrC family sensor kinase